jgi:KDO2-lipid IV(A) lauroyltransferase
LDRKRREIAISNLTFAFPEKNYDYIKKLALKSFVHYGFVFFDLIKISQLSEKKINSLFHLEGEEHLKEAISQNNGVLLFTAHFGNWEIAPWIISRYSKLHVIARKLDNPYLEKELLKFRKKLGSQVIYKKVATKKVLSALRRKEMVAILIDQNVLRSEAVFVDFFGRKAATTPSLAAFHLRTGAPIVPVFCYPQSGGKYKIQIQPFLKNSRTKSHQMDILKITQECTNIIEHEIRKNPQYWLWFHNRWKTRPKENDEINE